MNDRKKPNFVRQDAHKKSKLGTKWRKPRGLQSKLRLSFRGHGVDPNPGYGAPRATKGQIKGLEPVTVANVAGLEGLDKAKQGVIVSRTVGNRSRAAIMKKALELGLTVLNFVKPEDKLKSMEKK